MWSALYLRERKGGRQRGFQCSVNCSNLIDQQDSICFQCMDISLWSDIIAPWTCKSWTIQLENSPRSGSCIVWGQFNLKSFVMITNSIGWAQTGWQCSSFFLLSKIWLQSDTNFRFGLNQKKLSFCSFNSSLLFQDSGLSAELLSKLYHSSRYHMTKALHTKCKTCFGGPRMILPALRSSFLLEK